MGYNVEAAMRNDVSDLYCQQLEQYSTSTVRLELANSDRLENVRFFTVTLKKRNRGYDE